MAVRNRSHGFHAIGLDGHTVGCDGLTIDLAGLRARIDSPRGSLALFGPDLLSVCGVSVSTVARQVKEDTRIEAIDEVSKNRTVAASYFTSPQHCRGARCIVFRWLCRADSNRTASGGKHSRCSLPMFNHV